MSSEASIGDNPSGAANEAQNTPAGGDQQNATGGGNPLPHIDGFEDATAAAAAAAQQNNLTGAEDGEVTTGGGGDAGRTGMEDDETPMVERLERIQLRGKGASAVASNPTIYLSSSQEAGVLSALTCPILQLNGKGYPALSSQLTFQKEYRDYMKAVTRRNVEIAAKNNGQPHLELVDASLCVPQPYYETVLEDLQRFARANDWDYKPMTLTTKDIMTYIDKQSHARTQQGTLPALAKLEEVVDFPDNEGPAGFAAVTCMLKYQMEELNLTEYFYQRNDDDSLTLREEREAQLIQIVRKILIKPGGEYSAIFQNEFHRRIDHDKTLKNDYHRWWDAVTHRLTETLKAREHLVESGCFDVTVSKQAAPAGGGGTDYDYGDGSASGGGGGGGGGSRYRSPKPRGGGKPRGRGSQRGGGAGRGNSHGGGRGYQRDNGRGGSTQRGRGGGRGQPTPRAQSTPPAGRGGQGFACLKCKSPDHGVDDHPGISDDEAKKLKKAYWAERRTSGVGRQSVKHNAVQAVPVGEQELTPTASPVEIAPQEDYTLRAQVLKPNGQPSGIEVELLLILAVNLRLPCLVIWH
jgi:hypothetical protein